MQTKTQKHHKTTAKSVDFVVFLHTKTLNQELQIS